MSSLPHLFEQSNNVSSGESGIGVKRRDTNTPGSTDLPGRVSSKDASKKTKADEHRDLTALLFGPNLIKDINRIIKNKVKNKKLLDRDKGQGSLLEDFVAKHMPFLQNCNDPVMVKTKLHPDFCKDYNKVMKELGREHLTNVGDAISDLTRILEVLHFATEAEAGNSTGYGGLSKMLFGSGSSCIDFAKAFLWSSNIREIFEKELGLSKECSRQLWEVIKHKLIKSVTTIDHRMFISEDKDQFAKEVTKLVRDDNTNKSVLDIIGVMNAQYHNLYYFLKTGKMLPNIIFSTHVWKVADYQDVDTEVEGKIANLVGHLSHPETWVGGYMQNAANYSPELLEYFDGVISRGGIELVKYVLGIVRESLVTAKSSGEELDEEDLQLVKDIQDAVESSGEELVKDIDELIKKISSGDPIVGTSARRFGLGDLTPEEREALRELLLAMRVEAGITCGSMRTLVKAIMLGLLKREDIDTEEEALEVLPDILKKLITRHYEESDDNSATFSDFEKKIYDNEFKTYIDRAKRSKPAPKDIDKFVDKLKSLYKGSAKSGLMRILASKLFGSGGIDSDCEPDLIVTKLEELKSSMEVEGSASDDILVTFTKLLKFAPDYANELGTLAEKLQNMYLGVQTTRLMRSLANSIFGRLGKDCEDNDVVTELQRLKSLHDNVSQESRLSGESDGSSSENILDTFTALVEHASRYADPNSFASLATKLRNMFIGSITSGLMHTLASSILGSLGENCDDDDIVLELHKLKKLHELKDAKSGEDDQGESNGSTSKDEESDESLDAYTALVEHAPRYADVNCFASLATKLRNMHMGSVTAELMQTFASKMVEEYLVTNSEVLDDIVTITEELEVLYQQSKSILESETGNLKSDSNGSNTVQQAFLALLTHKPDIDIPSLASLVHYHVLNNKATFNDNFALLKKHIKKEFYKSGRLPNGCTVFVYSRDAEGNRNSLSTWWSDVIGYTTHGGKRAPQYKKASEEQMTRLRGIGVTDDFNAIDAAMEQAKHDKARGKMGEDVASMKQSTVSTLDNLFIGRGGGRGPFGGRGRGRGRAVRGIGPPGRGR